ncbi:MFS transporter [Kutzneria sp. CA-103260]|uniref:MFS transporter n=1 Tax=Kutzneria sp. CA-103260 TaxID=2802641 RepID=UPI0020118A8F|nr:MFS transporter [Kutzneria sp. CA-103260]
MRTLELSGAGLLACLVGAALPPIDLFVVNVALPNVQAGLAASPAELQWVVAAYGIGFALLLVVGGRLGDTFGRRRLFVLGLAGFTATSLICGLAPTAVVLVLARAAQGASAAMLAPQVLSVIQATTTGDRRARALGYYGATGGISMVVGQIAGGLLVAADIAGTGWRPVFLVNVPIGVVAIVLALRFLPETKAAHPLGVDAVGTCLLGVSLLALLVPLMQGTTVGWPLWCWVLLVLAPVLFAAFVAVEARAERRGRVPLLPPSVMTLSSMRLGLLIAAPFFLAFGGFLFVYTLVLQDDLRLGPMSAGLALTPLGLAMLVLALAASRLVGRLGNRVVTIGGLFLLFGPLVLVAVAVPAWPHVTLAGLLPGTALFGVGIGLVSPTLFRVILSRVPTQTAGVGSGALATTQQLSTALGVATLGSLFTVLRPVDPEIALVVVLVTIAGIAAAIAILSRGLPDPRE